MFYVRDIDNKKVSKVYAVSQDDEGYTRFLFNEDGKWYWYLAHHYEPI